MSQRLAAVGWSGPIKLCATLIVAGATVGCAGRGQVVAQPAPSEAAAPAPSGVPLNPALPAFEARQREAADSATQRGRWAEAIWALDVLQALNPNDATLKARRAQAEESVKLAASERRQQATLAQQRGDGEAATRLHLEVLSLQPTPGLQAEAAEALRALERERVARQHLGISARQAFARSPGQETLNVKAASAGRNDVEHASMMAAQGDVGGAIALLKPVNVQPNADPAARRLLADLYLRQAEGLWPQQASAAISAAERGLKADPKHKALHERLTQWRGSMAAPVVTGATRGPGGAASAAAPASPPAAANKPAR
jgi:hypothetical protein